MVAALEPIGGLVLQAAALLVFIEHDTRGHYVHVISETTADN